MSTRQPKIALRGYPGETKICIHKKVCIQMFTAALPVRAKAQKHLRVLPWLNKPWSILEAVSCNYIMLLK